MSDLAVGDVIEIQEIVDHGRDRWRPARIIVVEPHKIGAELTAGDFGQPGQNRIWLAPHLRGKTWRPL